MKSDGQWQLVRGGALRVALLFGSVAIAFAMLAVPLLDSRVRLNTARANIDMTTTGSIDRGSSSYTIRRSVLQSSPSAICVILQNGTHRGDC